MPLSRQQVSAFIAGLHIPGCTIGVAENGKTTFLEAFGDANVRESKPAQRDTIYCIGSLTKLFTSAAILQLVELGKIGLDDCAAPLLGVKAGGRSPSIRQLLSHTSGLSARLDRTMIAAPRPSIGKADALALLSDPEVVSAAEIEREWRYSNSGYFLLGLVVEAVSGITYGDYLRRNVFASAALHSTYVGAPPVELPVATGHRRTDVGFEDLDAPSAEVSFGSGGLWSTASDQLSWVRRLFSGEIVGTSMISEMVKPVGVDGKATNYGLGLFINTISGHTEWSHDSSTGGFSSQLAFYPADGLAVVVLTNGEAHVAERIEKLISRLLLNIEAPASERTSLSEEDIRKLVGTYQYSNVEIPVSATNEGLVIRTPTGRNELMLHTNAYRFFSAEDPAQTYEFFVQGSLADAFAVYREGKQLALARRLA